MESQSEYFEPFKEGEKFTENLFKNNIYLTEFSMINELSEFDESYLISMGEFA